MKYFDLGINKILKNILANLDNVEKILDVGSVKSTVDFLREIFSDSTIYALNIDKKALKEIPKERNLKVVLRDCQDMANFKNNFFDLIFCNQVLEHVLYPEKCLHECHRILKKNGTMVFTTPNLASWFNRLLLLFGYQPSNYTVSEEFKNLGLPTFLHKENIYDHPRVFTLRALKEIFEKTGFKITYLNVVNHAYPGQPYRRIRQILNMFLPRNWKENIIVEAVKR